MKAKSGALAVLSQMCFVSGALVFSAPAEFNGDDHDGQCMYMEEGKASNLPLGTNPSYTVEVEVKISSSFGSGNIVTWGDPNVSASIPSTAFFARITHNRIEHNWRGNNIMLTSPAATSIRDDQWHHLAWTFDGTWRCIHIDYVDDRSMCDRPTIDGDARNCFPGPGDQDCGNLKLDSGDTFCVGGGNNDGPMFNTPFGSGGSFRNLNIYNEGLTPAELQATTTPSMNFVSWTVGSGPTLAPLAVVGAIFLLVVT